MLPQLYWRGARYKTFDGIRWHEPQDTEILFFQRETPRTLSILNGMSATIYGRGKSTSHTVLLSLLGTRANTFFKGFYLLRFLRPLYSSFDVAILFSKASCGFPEEVFLRSLLIQKPLLPSVEKLFQPFGRVFQTDIQSDPVALHVISGDEAGFRILFPNTASSLEDFLYGKSSWTL